MTECRIYSNHGEHHFMTKRFDRVQGKKIHMQSLGALAHISYKEPGLCSYEMAAQYMKEIGLSVQEIEQFFRRMVFNCLAVNQDDHVKNVSFLMNRNGAWSLSPAYDITFSYNPTNKWLRAHQMSINQKNSSVELQDLVETALKMGIKKGKAMNIIAQITRVVADFQKYAMEAGIREKTYCDIQRVLEQNKVEI